MSSTLETVQSPDGGSNEGIRLLFWASGGDFDAFEQAIETDPTVTDSAVLTDAGPRRLYRVLYTDEGASYSPHRIRVEHDGTVPHAETIEEGWLVRMRFPDRSSVRAIRSWFVDRDLQFEITGLYEDQAGSEAVVGPSLTENQHDTLISAYEAGYYRIPREIGLVGLAEELGISDTAVSQRLRRGMATLVEFEMYQGRRSN